MRVIRFEFNGTDSYGIVDGDQVFRLEGQPYEGFDVRESVGPLEVIRLLAPCKPTKVVCVGANYTEVLKGRSGPLPEQPMTFLKAPNAVIGPGADIERPAGIDEFYFEGEMSIVIGRRAKGLTAADYREHIFGVTCGNDISVRDWIRPDIQWLRGKSLDTHCPLGPWIDTELSPTDGLELRTRVNGQVRQAANTRDLFFDVPFILEFVTQWMTLEAGDVVMTGTPAGPGPLFEGDLVEIEIEGLGTLKNRVRQK